MILILYYDFKSLLLNPNKSINIQYLHWTFLTNALCLWDCVDGSVCVMVVWHTSNLRYSWAPDLHWATNHMFHLLTLTLHTLPTNTKDSTDSVCVSKCVWRSVSQSPSCLPLLLSVPVKFMVNEAFLTPESVFLILLLYFSHTVFK